MWKQAVSIGALAFMLAGSTAMPAAAQSGKGGGHRGGHAERARHHDDQDHRGRNHGPGRHGRDDRRIENERLRALLPPGMTVEQAAAGFRNRGQFVAAVNAAHEHNVSFVQLKHLMVNERLSLGQALRRLRR